ncbi:hypothetical protein BK654_14210 [Pseudomonas brassicacearum]|nr:hypothetical protein BK654_14210 [Pseudomonas brassicacearum]
MKDPVSLNLSVADKRSRVFFGGRRRPDVLFVHQEGGVVRKLVIQMNDSLTGVGGILAKVARVINL